MASTATASLAAGGALAARKTEAPAQNYAALVVGRGKARDRIIRGWQDEPAIRQVWAADRADLALRILDSSRPELLALTGGWYSPALLAAAADRGVRAVYIDGPAADPGVLESYNRVCANRGLVAALADPVLYSQAFAAVGDLTSSGALGRLLEIRCTGGDAAKEACRNRLRHAIALATTNGRQPRSCLARIYRGTQLMSTDEAIAVQHGRDLVQGVSFHVSILLGGGGTLHIDCDGTRRSTSQTTRWSIVGSHGEVQVDAGSEPLARWRNAAPWARQRLWTRWQSLGLENRQTGSGKYAADSRAAKSARVAVRDLVAALENEREPRSSLASVCASERLLLLAVLSHRLQRHVAVRGPGTSPPMTGVAGIYMADCGASPGATMRQGHA